MHAYLANDFPAHLRGERSWVGGWVQRIYWYLQEGDVVALPYAPDIGFFEYVADLLELESSSITLIGPTVARGASDTNLPSMDSPEPDILGDLLRQAKLATGKSRLSGFTSFFPDTTSGYFGKSLVEQRAAAPLSGLEFAANSASEQLNDKGLFRALAITAGVPVPAGTVVGSKSDANVVIREMLEKFDHVIVKAPQGSGGRGNEILSTRAGIVPIGAGKVHRLSSREEIARYLDSRWGWLTGPWGGRVVVERYYPNSNAVFCEYHATDEGVSLTCYGDLVSDPFFSTSILPSQKGAAQELMCVLEHGERLADIAWRLGYRGVVAPDAIVTPVGDVFFTEWNLRETGTSHIHRIAARLIGEGYARTHTLVDTIGPPEWCAMPASAVAGLLNEAGLGFSRDRPRGIVISSPSDRNTPPRLTAFATSYESANRLISDVYRLR